MATRITDVPSFPAAGWYGSAWWSAPPEVNRKPVAPQVGSWSGLTPSRVRDKCGWRMTNTGGPEITVVVPTYRRPSLLAKCLGSLATQDLDPDRFEVVVVDDASGPETREVLEELSSAWPQLRWLVQDVNCGPAAARNRGIAAARSPLLLFVDDDIVAAPDLIPVHLRYHTDTDGLLGVVGLVQWLPGLRVTPFMQWLDSTDLQFSYGTWMREGRIERPWDAFYTCNLSLSAAMIGAVGGFDERFPYPAFEDVELGFRLSRQGFRLDYRPDALAWHARTMELDGFCRRMGQVGESVTVLRVVQPDAPFDVPADVEGQRRWRTGARHVVAAVAKVTPSDRIRALHYRAEINQAYREGVRRGRARVADLARERDLES
jgi:GT2 family glycosyltransferase